MVGNCCQDFNHWKLAELCKLLHNQWRCFTAVGKIKIDIGLNSLISAKYKMHVHWPPCWVSISGSRQTELLFLLFFFPTCCLCATEFSKTSTEFALIIQFLMVFICYRIYYIFLHLLTELTGKKRSFCASTKFNFGKSLLGTWPRTWWCCYVWDHT